LSLTNQWILEFFKLILVLSTDLSILAENKLNFNTDVNGAVFWCGENKEIIAQKWAKSRSKKTLEQVIIDS
jgi:hypothetical protein